MKHRILSLLLATILLAFLIFQAEAYTYTLEHEWFFSRFGRADIQDEHPSDVLDRSAVGFTFSTGVSNWRLGYVQFWLSRVGTPTSNLTATLYKESSGVPSGNALVYSDNLVNASTLTVSPVYWWVTFNFSESAYELNASTTYCLAVEANTSNVDGVSNYLYYGFTSTITTAYSRFQHYNGAWGVTSASYDYIFRIYSMYIEAPEVTYGGFNSTLNGSTSQFTFNFTDDVGLSHYVFGWNNSGTWTNSTTAISGTSNQSVFTQTLNATEGVRVEYQVWVNDSIDLWNTMPLMFFHTNTEPIIVVVTVNIPVLFVGTSLLLGGFGFLVFYARKKK